MGVLLQAFYWDAPTLEGRQAAWWPFLESQLPALAADGFTALWLPPSSKAAEWMSNGYDPYDYYDLGEFDQKGRTETLFGSRADLVRLIQSAHAHGLDVYADVVLNHNSGGDAQELNLLDGVTRWTKFTPASKKFKRDWTCFHPSTYETMDGWAEFGGMPDLCHRNPGVYAELMQYTRWLFEEIGYDGFRFDFVKGYGPWVVKSIAEYRYRRNKSGPFLKPFCVGECWDSDRTIEDWLRSINTSVADNPVSAFDFPLHYNLKGLCDTFGFDLRALTLDTLVNSDPFRAVTFVDNHDTIRDNASAVLHDKLLAYAVILTHEGYPSVFWQDFFNGGLAMRNTPNGIAALISVHERCAGGTSTVLYADHDTYLTQRTGYGKQSGLVLVLNNRGDGWNGARVRTTWPDTRLQPVAWWSATDLNRPQDKPTTSDGTTDLWAPPRGYAIYTPTL